MAEPLEMPSRNMSLRFLSGKLQGSEYVLGEAMQVIIGRSSDADLILLEGMVSRHHSRLSLSRGELSIEDMGSTNGTFVNGTKVKGQRRLLEGDRVLIGTSILKVVLSDQPIGTVPPRPDPSQLDELKTSDGNQLQGVLEEISVPELLELLATTRQNGVLELTHDERRGTITVHDGSVQDARIADLPDDAPAQKSIERMLHWNRGGFALHSYRAPPIRRLDVQVPQLLVDGLFKIDELNVLLQRLPAAGSKLLLARPLTPMLSALDEIELDVLQLAHNQGSVQAVLDCSTETDLETAKRLLTLVERGYLRRG